MKIVKLQLVEMFNEGELSSFRGLHDNFGDEGDEIGKQSI
jgi:hypothetical protein